MVKIHYEVDGKRVEPENLADAMMEQILNGIAEEVKKELGSTYCEEHEEYPTVIIKGIEDDNITLSIETCCQDLLDRAQEKISD